MSADVVFRNGKVFTASTSTLFTEGLAVKGGQLAALGSDAEIAGFVGPNTEIVDLDGRLATPGFIDAHVHVATSGLDLLRVSFDGCNDEDDAVAAVVRYAADHPDEPWILGSGWSQSWFERGCPNAGLLDRVVGDKPVFISNRDGHGAWVNSRALEISGIDSETPDPPDGRIERNADGSPQGTLHEGAMNLVERCAPPDTADDFEKGLLLGQEIMLQFGITGWQEASVRPEVQEAYLRVAASGQLKGDVVGALWWERDEGIEQIEQLVERRKMAAPGFRPTSVKLMLDGVAENFTASVLDPYLDGMGGKTTNQGVDFIDPIELRKIVTRLDALEFQCHFHALGDRAVRYGLDALEAALKANGPSDNRHHLAHLQFVHPDDLQRFAPIGAIANVQPLWACNEDYQNLLTRPFITPERDSWQYPFGFLVGAGARIGMGSDWNVSTANVMEEIDVAVTRTCTDGTEPLGPEQALSAVTALTAFTMGSAYINHSEGHSGSLEVGKRADIAIFDRDPLRAGRFRDARVDQTYVAGKLVYERS